MKRKIKQNKTKKKQKNKQIKTMEISKYLDIIITSDHGMSQMSNDRRIIVKINTIINKHTYIHTHTYTYTHTHTQK